MSGSLIKEYLIGFGFQMDEAGAESAKAALEGILEAARQIEPQVKAAAGAFAGLSSPVKLDIAFEFPEEALKTSLTKAKAAIEGLSLTLDPSEFLESLSSARKGAEEFARVVDAHLSPLNGLPVSIDLQPLSEGVYQIKAASSTIQSEMGAAQNSVRSVAEAGKSFSSLSGAASAAFRSISASAQAQMKAAAASVNAYVQRMLSSLKTLSSAMSSAGAPSRKFSVGGVVERETKATIGEDGREYVIPVTKPDRAIPLLKAALEDLNLNSESVLSAAKQLGGSATANKSPTYIQPTSKRETVNNSVVNHNVSAPATINVYGSDAESVAKNVERNQEMLLIRNIKGVYA